MRARKKVTWKTTVQRALTKLGPGDHTRAEILAAIPARRRRKTWKQTVSRVLQELRAEGSVGFQSRHNPRLKGRYVISAHSPQEILERITPILASEYDIEESSVEPRLRKNGTVHDLFQWMLDEPTDSVDALSEAAIALDKYYPGKRTAVTLVVDVTAHDGASVRQWMTLGPHTPSPRIAGSQLHYMMAEHAQHGKYGVSEQIVGFEISVEE